MSAGGYVVWCVLRLVMICVRCQRSKGASGSSGCGRLYYLTQAWTTYIVSGGLHLNGVVTIAQLGQAKASDRGHIVDLGEQVAVALSSQLNDSACRSQNGVSK